MKTLTKKKIPFKVKTPIKKRLVKEKESDGAFMIEVVSEATKKMKESKGGKDKKDYGNKRKKYDNEKDTRKSNKLSAQLIFLLNSIV